MRTRQPASEHRALLGQVLGYLVWEEELSGFGVPPLVREPYLAVEPVSPLAEHDAPAEAEYEPADGAGLLAALPSAEPSEPAGDREGVARPAQPPQAGLPFVGGETETRAGLAALARSLPIAPVTPPDQARTQLALLDTEVRSCTRCDLHKARTHTVFARGNPEAALMFVGEGPGQEEDKTGQPFVGPAGQLLDKMIAAMGFGRDEVYVCNVVKCRPPGNRTPLPAEAGACAAFLLGQVDLVRPRVIVALGRCAAENMGLVAGGSWRGRWGRFREIDVMPTYHPAFLLRSPEYKRPVWEDLQKVMEKLRNFAV